MMRWPSAYCAISRGMSRSTMRSNTQPTRPEELRTMYQSSITGLGGSASLVLPTTLGFLLGWVAGAGGVCVGCTTGADGVWLAGLPGADGGCLDCGVPLLTAWGELAAAGFGWFFGAVARFRMSIFSPSLSW